MLRKDPDVAASVSQLLAHYSRQFREGMVQGKNPMTRQQSGCCNTQDTCISEPAMRWPNEGVVGAANERRLPYDELSLPQCVTAQLYNAVQISDPSKMWDVLYQFIYTMRDVSSGHPGSKYYLKQMQGQRQSELKGSINEK